MPALAIELNDAGLRVAREGHATLLSIDGARDSSPGVAILDGRELTTGWAAVAQASLRPLAADSRFWDRLGTDPVDPRHGGSPNRAEVAFEHLAAVVRTVREPGDVLVLAVPPTYDRTQLGLLLSMVQELELPIAGFVPIPIAVESDPELDDRVLLVDLSMHRSTLTVLDRGERVTATRSRSVPDVGLHGLHRRKDLRITHFQPAPRRLAHPPGMPPPFKGRTHKCFHYRQGLLRRGPTRAQTGDIRIIVTPRHYRVLHRTKASRPHPPHPVGRDAHPDPRFANEDPNICRACRHRTRYRVRIVRVVHRLSTVCPKIDHFIARRPKCLDQRALDFYSPVVRPYRNSQSPVLHPD